MALKGQRHLRCGVHNRAGHHEVLGVGTVLQAACSVSGMLSPPQITPAIAITQSKGPIAKKIKVLPWHCAYQVGNLGW